jgi:hypothetical protein
MGCGGMDWIYLAQDMDRWRALIQWSDESSGSLKGGEFPD